MGANCPIPHVPSASSARRQICALGRFTTDCLSIEYTCAASDGGARERHFASSGLAMAPVPGPVDLPDFVPELGRRRPVHRGDAADARSIRRPGPLAWAMAAVLPLPVPVGLERALG